MSDNLYKGPSEDRVGHVESPSPSPSGKSSGFKRPASIRMKVVCNAVDFVQLLLLHHLINIPRSR